MTATSVLRAQARDERPEVTTPELFFDLVYVFAVTQLSHTLHAHLDGRGALETLVLFVAVWWAWNYTAWATNWIDPDHAARNYLQLLTWSCIAGVFWLSGAFVHGDARLFVWIAAVVVDYAAPLHGFALPRLGRTPMRDWPLAGGHLAERNRLVLLIALGESILAVGATFAGMHWTGGRASAFAVGFVATAALWWIYFAQAEEAAEMVQQADDPARVARGGFAYAHGIMVAGVIVVAVAIELTITEPTADSAWANAATILGGGALYLAGNALYKRALLGRLPTSRVLAVVALACLVPISTLANRLVISVLAMLVLLALAAWTATGLYGAAPAAHGRG